MARSSTPAPSRGVHSASLRDATASLHRRVEQRIDVRRSFASIESYRVLLGRLLGFHHPLEPLLMQHAHAFPDLVPTPPRRQRLRDDLHVLGSEPRAFAHCTWLPSLDGPSRTLGVLYVVEGSALGGAVLAALAKRRLDLTPTSGCAFFSGDGDAAAAARWPALLEHVEHYGAAGELPEVIAGAIDAFERLDDWLVATDI